MHHILKKPSSNVNFLKLKLYQYKAKYFERVPVKKLFNVVVLLLFITMLIYFIYPKKRYNSAIGCKSRLAEVEFQFCFLFFFRLFIEDLINHIDAD